jgi:AAA family ATP:ADP antiporter
MPNPFQAGFFFRSHTVALFVLLFCSFAMVIIGDSTTEALLLAHYGAQIIRWMFLVNALFLFGTSLFTLPLIDRIDRGRLFFIFLMVHGCIIALAWLASLCNYQALYIPLFSYAYVSKIFVFLLFWTIANDLIDSRSAGKQFPFIAAGGTLGAISISFAIPLLLKVLQPQALLLAWSFLSFLVGVLFLPIWRSFGRHLKTETVAKRNPTRRTTILRDLRLVQSEPLLRTMAILYLLLFFVLLNQQFWFYNSLKTHLGDARRIASFLGVFNGVSMGATFLLQLFVAGKIIKRVGSTRAMLLLPIVFCAIFLFLAIYGKIADTTSAPALLFWAIAGGVALRIAFFDSFFSPNFQLFFSSLPRDVRGRGKITIEGVVKPLAIASAGLWLIFFSRHYALWINMTVYLCFSAAMVVQTCLLKRKYTESIRNYLYKYSARKLSPHSSLTPIGGRQDVLAILKNLYQTEPDDVKGFIVEVLAEINTPQSIETLCLLCNQAEAKLRSKIVSALATLKSARLISFFEAHLDDCDLRVVANAIAALGELSDSQRPSKLIPFLSHSDQRVRGNTIVALWLQSERGHHDVVLQSLHQMLISDDCGMRASGLYALGAIKAPEVFFAEIGAVYEANRNSIGKNRTVWRQFIKALTSYPSDTVVDMLLDSAMNVETWRRKEVSAALTSCIEQGYPIEQLLARLGSENFMQRALVLQALNMGRQAINRRHHRILETMAENEISGIYRDWLAIAALTARPKSDALHLLISAIQEECIRERLDCLIQSAALLDTSGQIREVIGRLRHMNNHIRACACEVLDNAGKSRLNRMILGLLDSDRPMVHAEFAIAHLGMTSMDAGAVQRYLETCPNQWVRMCAQPVMASDYVSQGAV